MKGYVIIGECGEHSNKSWWVVAAFSELEVAEYHLKELKDWTLGWRANKKHIYERPDSGSNPFDPNMESDINGPEYTLIETRHFLHIDEVKEAAGL